MSTGAARLSNMPPKARAGSNKRTSGHRKTPLGSRAEVALAAASPLQIAKRRDIPVSQQQIATAAPPSNKDSSSAAVAPKFATTVVSRGDSLWRISRVTYGTGKRYAFVYKANRDRIRDPDRIYPGQIFVLPMKAR